MGYWRIFKTDDLFTLEMQRDEIFKLKLQKKYVDEMVLNIFQQVHITEEVLKAINKKAEEYADKMINEDKIKNK